MLLTVDIGNTNIVSGVFGYEGLLRHWRLSSDKKRTSDEYGLEFLGLIEAAGLDKKEINGAIISSVVPGLNAAVGGALRDYLGLKPLFAGETIDYGMPVVTENPSEVGPDRIVNAVAAWREHKRPLIIVDFGTAVTFDYVTPKGEYAGGVIAPGVNISAEALFKNTAKLPLIEPKRPERVIGSTTVASMRSGLFWGFVGLVDGIIERMIKECATEPRVVSTGGLAGLIIGESRYVKDTDEFLTLKGLKSIYEGKR